MPALSPIFNGYQSFTSGGLPNAGGFIYTYAAGTTTPLATYTTNGTTANTNPIALSASGVPPNEIWLTTGSAYKFVVTDSTTAVIGTYDNIVGMISASSDITALTALKSVNGGQLAGMRNRIINGGMQVSQRFGTGLAAIPNGVRTFVVDRSTVYVQGAATSGWQSIGGGPEGSLATNCIVVSGAAGVTSIQLLQPIEAVNSSDLAGKQVTLSVWIYLSAGGPLNVSGSINRAVTADTITGNISDVTLTMSSSTLSSGTWTKFTGTGTLSASATLGIETNINLGGSIPAGVSVRFSYLQLELGSVATPFEQRPYGSELALCQRFFEKSFPQGTKPAQALGTVASGANRFSASKAGSASLNYGFISYKVTKRVAPLTLTGYNPLNANSLPLDASLAVDCTSNTMVATDAGIFCSWNNAGATTVGNAIDWAWAVDAEIY